MLTARSSVSSYSDHRDRNHVSGDAAMKQWLPVVIGLVVGVIAAFVAFGLLIGATWSSMHSGESALRRELTMLGITTLLSLAPVGLAFLAWWLTHRAMSDS